MLVYSTLCSLDGYVDDADGAFDWAAPDEEVHAQVNDLSRSVGTFLLGRRTYETLAVWDTYGGPDQPAVINDFAVIWRAADKVVFSTTLAQVDAPRTRLERAFDRSAVQELVAAADGDVAVGGPGLAAAALRAGLVEEVQLFLAPVVVGGGTRALPDGVRLGLQLVDEHRSSSGFVHLRYRARR